MWPTDVCCSLHESIIERFIDMFLLCHLSIPLLQNTIDGDLCEMYNAMDPAKQKSIAEELDRTPNEV